MGKINSNFNSGDINLVAAMQAVGVPPASEPRLVLSDDGRSYARFYLCFQTVKGVETTSLSNQWSNHGAPRYEVDTFFTEICTFIQDARRSGARTASDYFDHAHTWLHEKGCLPPDAPKNIEATPDFVSRHGEDIPGHVFAFCHEREILFQKAKTCKRRLLISRDNHHAAIDTDLAKPIRNELLSRMEG